MRNLFSRNSGSVGQVGIPTWLHSRRLVSLGGGGGGGYAAEILSYLTVTNGLVAAWDPADTTQPGYITDVVGGYHAHLGSSADDTNGDPTVDAANGVISYTGGQTCAAPHTAALNPTAGMTVITAVKGSANGTYQRLASKQGAFILRTKADGVLEWVVFIGGAAKIYGIAGASLFSDWATFSGSYDGSTQFVHANGRPVGSIAQGGSIDVATNPFQLGSMSESPVGEQGVTLLYNRALTDTEQAQVHADLVAYARAKQWAYKLLPARTGTLYDYLTTKAGLKGLWDPFGSTAGTIAELVGARDAAFAASPRNPTLDAVGGVTSYDGVDDYASAPSDAAFNLATNRITALAVAKPTDNNLYETMIQRPGGFILRLHNDGAPIFYGFAAGSPYHALAAAGATDFGMWRMYTGIFTGSAIKVYKGSGEIASAAHSITLDNPTNPIEIGGDSPASPTAPFQGSLGPTMFWDRALTPWELGHVYQDIKNYAADKGLSYSTLP